MRRHIIINCAGVLYWNVSSVPFNCRACNINYDC